MLPDTLWGQQIGALETDVNQYARTRDVEGIVFACAYLKREVLARIGGLSENFRSYFEDTDYCLRAREAGFRTVVCGAVTLVHREHGSTSDEPKTFETLFQASRKTFREPLGATARGAVPARPLVAVDPEFPDRLRDELPRDPARLRRRGYPRRLHVRLRARHALSRTRGRRRARLSPERDRPPAERAAPARVRRLRTGRRLSPQQGPAPDRLHDARGGRLPRGVGAAGERDGRDLGAVRLQP